jgi:hypothetical protein
MIPLFPTKFPIAFLRALATSPCPIFIYITHCTKQNIQFKKYFDNCRIYTKNNSNFKKTKTATVIMKKRKKKNKKRRRRSRRW